MIINQFFFCLGKDLLELLDQEDQPVFQRNNSQKSATIKSTNTDYNTPPESPTLPHPIFKTMGESMEKPPVAPPR